jgi:protoheme IX farnesyltransferase
MLNPRTSTVHDYWMLLKPTVMSLVIFTAFCGFLLAPGSVHPIQAVVSLVAIAIGAGGAGTLNMWYEWKKDAVMTRTQRRPIPSGVIRPGDALAFGMSLSIASIFMLFFAANFLAAALLAFTIVFYALIYTVWLKPYTAQNIVIGGIAGALPPVIGWVVVSETFSWFPIFLFLIIFFWTPMHFWALALYKVEDYEQAGIPMMPSFVGLKKTCEKMFVYAVLTVVTSLVPVLMGFLGVLYGVIAVLLGAYLLGLTWQVWKNDMQKAGRLFGYSILYLFLLFLGMVIA